MRSLSAVVTLATILLGVALSIRLLLLAVRTRKTPELAMALYCALVTTGSVLYVIIIGGGFGPETAAAHWLSAAFTLCVALGAISLAVGIWRIFRPDEAWMRAAVAAVGLWIGAGWLACVLSGGSITLGDETLANVVFLSGRVVVYGFGAFEAFRYARMLKRRVALGLADALSAHQMMLWGTAWICFALVGISSFVIVHFAGREAFLGLWAPLFISGVNASAWICVWLAFFPPTAYQRWATGRAASAVA